MEGSQFVFISRGRGRLNLLEQHHTKTGRAILVILETKEGLAGTNLAKSSFSITPTIKHNP